MWVFGYSVSESAAPTETARRLVVASMKLAKYVIHSRKMGADDIEGDLQSGKAVILTVSRRSTELRFLAVSRANAKVARLGKMGGFDDSSDTMVSCGRCLHLGIAVTEQS